MTTDEKLAKCITDINEFLGTDLRKSDWVYLGDNRELLTCVRLAAERYNAKTLPADFIESTLAIGYSLAYLKASDRALGRAIAEGYGDVGKTVAAFNRELGDLLESASIGGLASRVIGAPAGGSSEKFRKGIYEAIVDFMKSNREASSQTVWQSFPDSYEEAQSVGEDLRYAVFRDGADLYQVDSSGKTNKYLSICRKVFDSYVTKARDEIGISTRRKKRN